LTVEFRIGQKSSQKNCHQICWAHLYTDLQTYRPTDLQTYSPCCWDDGLIDLKFVEERDIRTRKAKPGKALSKRNSHSNHDSSFTKWTMRQNRHFQAFCTLKKRFEATSHLTEFKNLPAKKFLKKEKRQFFLDLKIEENISKPLPTNTACELTFDV
jgi:hypothetical protein